MARLPKVKQVKKFRRQLGTDLLRKQFNDEIKIKRMGNLNEWKKQQ